MIFKVRRYEPSSGESRYDIFEIEVQPGMTVLDALFRIQDGMDDSLAFRYSCRGAVCGSCAMLINRVPRLACRTQVASLIEGGGRVDLKPYPAIEGGEQWNSARQVMVEPLPHLRVLKDLVVDMNKFFEFYRAVEPVLKPANSMPDREYLMNPEAVRELEHYTNCILCAACVGACPINAERSDYLGPAALAKLYRFYLDPREADHASRLSSADRSSGWWGCEFHTNCKRVCPKGVASNLAIGGARRLLAGKDK